MNDQKEIQPDSTKSWEDSAKLWDDISALLEKNRRESDWKIQSEIDHPHIKFTKDALGYIFRLPGVKEQSQFLYWLLKISRYPISILLTLWLTWRFLHPIIDWVHASVVNIDKLTILFWAFVIILIPTIIILFLPLFIKTKTHLLRFIICISSYTSKFCPIVYKKKKSLSQSDKKQDVNKD